MSELRKNAQAEREAFMKILTNPLSDEITGSQAVEMQNVFDAFFPTLTVDFVDQQGATTIPSICTKARDQSDGKQQTCKVIKYGFNEGKSIGVSIVEPFFLKFA